MLRQILPFALVISLLAASLAHPLRPRVDALGLELRPPNFQPGAYDLPLADPLAFVGPRQLDDPEPSPPFDDVVLTSSPEPSLDSTPDPDFVFPSPELFLGAGSAFPRPTSSPRANTGELSTIEANQASPVPPPPSGPPPLPSGSPPPPENGISEEPTGAEGPPPNGDGGLPPLPEGPPPIIHEGPRTTCFSGGVSVVVNGKGETRMDEVEVGDWVLVGEGRFDRVFAFTHRLSGGRRRFVRLVTVGGREVRATAGHFVYVQEGVKRAGDVVVGDFVPTADGGLERVVQAGEVLDEGLFNPQTLSGDIVVGGVRVTTYTEAVTPIAAHALLAPVRAVYRAFGVSSSALEEGWEGLPRVLRPVA